MIPLISRIVLLGGLLVLPGLPSLAAQTTVNVGTVATSTNTGYFLNANGTLSTNGQILVGYFSKSQSELAAIISGWDDSLPTYDHYTALAAYFTTIGTGASNYGSTVPGWYFNANGAVSGTSAGVSTNILPSGTQLYVWSFGGTTNLTSNGLSASSQWGLVTSTNWSAPASGTASLVLSGVSSSGVLIGNDLSGTASANSNSVAMFTQRSVSWTNRGGDSLWNSSSTNWNYSGSAVTFQNGDLVAFGGNASGTITIQTNGVKPGGMTFALSNSLTLTGGNIDGSGNLALSGLGTLTLAAANSFKGGTVLNGASLVLGNASALGTGSIAVASNSLIQPSVSMNLSNPVTLASTATLTFQTPSSVTLTESGIISGTGGLTKSGIGTLILNRAETYSGATAINSGTLNLGTTGSLLSSTNVTVSSGGTLLLGGSNQLSQTASLNLNGGTLSMGGSSVRANSLAVGSLTLTANSVIDFSSLGGASSFTVESIKGLSANSILSIYNYDPSRTVTRLFDSAGSSDFSPALLADIKFYSGTGSGFLGVAGFSGNEIMPVPEPSVVLALLVCGALMLGHGFRLYPRKAVA